MWWGAVVAIGHMIEQQFDQRKRKAVLQSREEIERDVRASQEAQAAYEETMKRLRAQWAEEDRIYKRNMFLKKLGPKGQRMNDRMARRRDQIRYRNWMIVGQVVFWCCAPAVGVAVIALIWRLCAYAIVF